MIENFSLDKTYKYLLLSLAFFLPLTVFGANVVIFFIVVLWFFSGNYRSKYTQIISSKLLLASLIFYGVHILGMFWTEDLSWGFEILHKMWYFLLLLPILFTISKKEYFNHCTIVFLSAIALTEVVSYLIWFEIISPFKNATVINPTPFMTHISYNPILAFATYIVMHQVFFNKGLSRINFFWCSFFAISMSITMFITGGRAGQVMYFVMLSILIFQFFNFEKVKSFFAVIIVIPVIFFIAYQTSPLFQERVNLSLSEVLTYEKTSDKSVGVRITYAINSWEIIKENALIGVGTGDFPVEYDKINTANKSNTPNSTNPHNMYTLILVQLGLLGLISMLSIFYYQIKLSFNSSNKFIRDAGITLPLLFLVVMLSDSYLLGHYTTLMFVFFSAFLYQDSEKTY